MRRIVAMLLAIVMLVGMLPMQAFASETSYVYVSFEAYDADGTGRTLIKPERSERVKYTNDYALAAMRQAIGSDSDVNLPGSAAIVLLITIMKRSGDTGSIPKVSISRMESRRSPQL